jgi:subtilisin family serine protease
MKRRAGFVCAVVVASVALTSPASTVASPVVGAANTVTLVTGDQVTPRDGGRFTVRPADGREHVVFRSMLRDGHLHVIPSDATPMLSRGQLDRRLFDVTELLRLPAAARTELPILLTQTGTRSLSTPARMDVDRRLPAVRGVAGRVKRADLPAMWRDVNAMGAGGPKLWLDGLRKMTLDRSVPRIGAPAAWSAGYDGAGVTVAVLDSGIDSTHPDLAGKVRAQQNFVSGEEDDLDRAGHGTHVASTIAGTGAASGGRLKGVAPGAKLLDGKVCTVDYCPESAILAGMQWAAADQKAKIVNLSIGGSDSPELDPIEQAVNELSARYGTLFVIAAGNDGGDSTVNSPGSADAALTVGAVDGDDRLADFSSRGPRRGDFALKPDLTAPSVDIDAALGKDSGGPASEHYAAHSGTSMATPHVAGAAALLAQRDSAMSGPRLKAVLMGSAAPQPDTGVFAQGAGRVDVASAMATVLTASPPSVSFGQQRWPHADDPLSRRTVTYHNAGSTDATVRLAVQGAGTFTLSASQLKVPAGGEATVTLTADTRTTAPGQIGGYVVATGAGPEIRTPFAVDVEAESYDLTIHHVGRSDPTAYGSSDWITRLDGRDFYFSYNETSESSLRLPTGRYTLDTYLMEADPDDPDGWLVSDLQQPVLDLTEDTTVRADFRTAAPVSVTVPKAGARRFTTDLVTRIESDVPGNSGIRMGASARLFTGTIGGGRLDAFIQSLHMEWMEPGVDGSFADSPYTYNLTWTRRGGPFHGLRRDVRDGDLATVTRTYLTQLPGSPGQVDIEPTTAVGGIGGWSSPIHLPFTRTEYLSTEPGTVYSVWASTHLENSSQTGLVYEAGRHIRETFNKPPFGPVASGSRDGDRLFIQAGLAAPSGAGTHGGSRLSNGAMRLFRDGVLVAESTNEMLSLDVVVPLEPSRYRLEANAEREAPFTLATKVAAVWQFTSSGADTRLPLPAVRLAPELTDDGTAPTGRPLAVPISTEHLANASVTMDVSFNDGVTWTAVPVHRSVAIVKHPPRAGFVSLRVKATSTEGNSVEQTVIHAYQIG